MHNKTPVNPTWGLLRVCAACPTPRHNQSYELRPPWEQHLRYVPHRVRNGYNWKKQGVEVHYKTRSGKCCAKCDWRTR
jgi:hypothetical protein